MCMLPLLQYSHGPWIFCSFPVFSLFAVLEVSVVILPSSDFIFLVMKIHISRDCTQTVSHRIGVTQYPLLQKRLGNLQVDFVRKDEQGTGYCGGSLMSVWRTKNNLDVRSQGNEMSFFFFWLCWVFLALRGFSLVAVSGDYSQGAGAPHCDGFSCCRARALGTWASVITVLELSSCGSWTLEHTAPGVVAQGMGNLPQPGIEPMSPALARGFFSTVQPGKSSRMSFATNSLNELCH